MGNVYLWQTEQSLLEGFFLSPEAVVIAKQRGKTVREFWIDEVLREMIRLGMFETKIENGQTYFRASNTLRCLYEADMNKGGSA